VRAGETVLVHAAAGGVGLAVAELGKIIGCRVIGLASAGKHDVLRQYGAREKLRYLRDISLPEVPREAERHYRFRPGFLRAIADHIAGMTDKFALQEFEDLTAAFPGRGPL